MSNVLRVSDITTFRRALRRMAKELAKKTSGLISSISSFSTISIGELSTRPSRAAYDEVPGQAQEHTLPAHEVLAERASRAGKLGGSISSGGLSTRPSRKAYEEVKSPFEEQEKPSASTLKTVGEDAEVYHTQMLVRLHVAVHTHYTHCWSRHI